ncbi:MAG TPA: hypothetical protein VGR00_06845, partial [Thermoanaerobaculia bacterium]|nr:hypothetical protein [Thermoanaerobaculia bacterium]
LLADAEKRLDALRAEKFQPIEVEREAAMLALLAARWEESRGRSPAKEASRAAVHAEKTLALDSGDEEAKSLLLDARRLAGRE